MLGRPTTRLAAVRRLVRADQVRIQQPPLEAAWGFPGACIASRQFMGLGLVLLISYF
jgi:hypothetical protein